MAITSWTKTAQWAPGWSPEIESLWCDSVPSTLRDREGRLVLGNNPLTRRHRRNIAHKITGPDGGGRYPTPSPTGYLYDTLTFTEEIFRNAQTTATNRAYGRYQKAIRQGQGSSLGVAFASARQSADMILSKGKGLSDFLEKGPRVKPGHQRTLSQRSSDAYLEWIFGWTPLYEDIVSGLTTVITHNPVWDNQRIRVTATSHVQGVYTGQDAGYSVKDSYTMKCRVTYTCRVRVTNPNLWLANKLGLVALPSVAWDLVPWSFVVNRFGNFSQMIGSLTDSLGTTCLDESVTRTHTWTGTATYTNNIDPRINGWATYENRLKTRLVQTPLVPQLELRIPDLKVDDLSTLTALIGQKIPILSQVVPPIHRRYLTTKGYKIPREYWHL